MVYKTYCRYKYDVTYMMMTSLTSAACLLLRPTVALVDRDYQFLNAALPQQQQNDDDEMSFSKPIYIYRSYEVLFNFDLCEARFEAFSAKFGFSPFFRLYGLLNGFLSRIWTYFS